MYQIKDAAHAAEIMSADQACSAGRITCSGCPLNHLGFSGGYNCGHIIDRAKDYINRHNGDAK